MRFEADETSISIATFEKLLENLDINYLDYLTFYYDHTDPETTEFANRLQKLLQSGSSSKLVNECKKELKNKDIDFSKRLTILIYLNNILWKGYCTQKIGQNIQLFLFSILNFKVSKFYYF